MLWCENKYFLLAYFPENVPHNYLLIVCLVGYISPHASENLSNSLLKVSVLPSWLRSPAPTRESETTGRSDKVVAFYHFLGHGVRMWSCWRSRYRKLSRSCWYLLQLITGGVARRNHHAAHLIRYTFHSIFSSLKSHFLDLLEGWTNQRSLSGQIGNLMSLLFLAECHFAITLTIQNQRLLWCPSRPYCCNPCNASV